MTDTPSPEAGALEAAARALAHHNDQDPDERLGDGLVRWQTYLPDVRVALAAHNAARAPEDVAPERCPANLCDGSGVIPARFFSGGRMAPEQACPVCQPVHAPEDVAGLCERLEAEETRMQSVYEYICTLRDKQVTPSGAFTDFNQLKHAFSGRDPVLSEAATALAAVQAERDEARAQLASIPATEPDLAALLKWLRSWPWLDKYDPQSTGWVDSAGRAFKDAADNLERLDHVRRVDVWATQALLQLLHENGIEPGSKALLDAAERYADRAESLTRERDAALAKLEEISELGPSDDEEGCREGMDFDTWDAGFTEGLNRMGRIARAALGEQEKQ